LAIEHRGSVADFPRGVQGWIAADKQFRLSGATVVMASEAKQSSLFRELDSGLLRRYRSSQ
jgi:hypothetical protein